MAEKKLIELRDKIKGKKPRFYRKDYWKISRLGKKRKKLLTWRRPRGRHSKIREKWKGYFRQPSVGWGSPNEVKGTVNGLFPKLINNLNELKLIKNNEIAIVGKIGNKKKIEIAKYAIEKNLKLLNLNTKKFLEKIEQGKKKGLVKTEIKKEIKTQKKEIKKEEKK
jgi:large subunit ribosomal protein L32e